jgi:hypothetical protein
MVYAVGACNGSKTKRGLDVGQCRWLTIWNSGRCVYGLLPVLICPCRCSAEMIWSPTIRMRLTQRACMGCTKVMQGAACRLELLQQGRRAKGRKGKRSKTTRHDVARQSVVERGLKRVILVQNGPTLDGRRPAGSGTGGNKCVSQAGHRAGGHGPFSVLSMSYCRRYWF